MGRTGRGRRPRARSNTLNITVLRSSTPRNSPHDHRSETIGDYVLRWCLTTSVRRQAGGELRTLVRSASTAVAQLGRECTPPAALAHDDARAEAARQVGVLAAEHRLAALQARMRAPACSSLLGNASWRCVRGGGRSSLPHAGRGRRTVLGGVRQRRTLPWTRWRLVLLYQRAVDHGQSRGHDGIRLPEVLWDVVHVRLEHASPT